MSAGTNIILSSLCMHESPENSHPTLVVESSSAVLWWKEFVMTLGTLFQCEHYPPDPSLSIELTQSYSVVW
jgi:hypothetical protein